MFRRVAGRPALPRMDLAAWAAADEVSVPPQDRLRGRRAAASCAGRAFGITPSRMASSTRQACPVRDWRRGDRPPEIGERVAQTNIGGLPRLPRWDSRSRPVTVIRRKTQPQAHDRRSSRPDARRATQLVRAVDEILGTHRDAAAFRGLDAGSRSAPTPDHPSTTIARRLQDRHAAAHARSHGEP